MTKNEVSADIVDFRGLNFLIYVHLRICGVRLGNYT